MISCSPFMGIRRSPYPDRHSMSLSRVRTVSPVLTACNYLCKQYSLAKDMNGHELGVAYQKRAHPTRRTGGFNPLNSHPYEAATIHEVTGSRS